MLEFNIQINNGVLTKINTPLNFDKTDFNLTRSKDLYSVTSSFAGNKADFEFNKDVHNNIFEGLLNEYILKGFNADVKLYITWNGNDIFNGNFDFSQAETDLVNYIRCQVIKKDKLFYLEKNKSLEVEMFSGSGLNGLSASSVVSVPLRLNSVALRRVSRWEDGANNYTMSSTGLSVGFNNIRTQRSDAISDSLNWLDLRRDWNELRGRNYKLIDARENLKNVNIRVNYSSDSVVFASPSVTGQLILTLGYGNDIAGMSSNDWYNSLNKIELRTINLNGGNEIPINLDFSTTITSLPRDTGIWLFWFVPSAGTVGNFIYMRNVSSFVEISADTTTYPSYLQGVTYKNLVANVVKKTANINNVVWNVSDYDKTLSFNGSLLRRLFSPTFRVKWEDVKKQLQERNLGCYYDESLDTLFIDSRNNILGYNNILKLDSLAKYSKFNVSEDDYFIINQFNYKYSKFQALKDDYVEGNASSVHGSSEWNVQNNGFEGNISIDLPFVRDNFLIEEIRRKTIETKEDTATNEDDTVILLESDAVTSNTEMQEILFLQASCEGTQQTFVNDGSFSWVKMIGGGDITVNSEGYNYFIISITDRTLILGKPSSNLVEFNGTGSYLIRWRFSSGYLGNITNGMLNLSFSLRQNIERWKQTLMSSNFYNSLPIINTSYKENGTAIINGLQENANIIPSGALHSSRLIETTEITTVEQYFYLATNKQGYITVYNSKNEEINIYINDLKAVFLDGCERMEVTIKGWLKI